MCKKWDQDGGAASARNLCVHLTDHDALIADQYTNPSGVDTNNTGLLIKTSVGSSTVPPSWGMGPVHCTARWNAVGRNLHSVSACSVVSCALDMRFLGKLLHCVRTAHADAGILTQDYLSPV